MEFDRWGNQTRTFSQTVSANTTVWDDVVIPNGEQWVIRGAEGSGPDIDGANVAVVWDRSGVNETLFVCYGAHAAPIQRVLTGDGVKKLSLKLQNRTLLTSVVLLCRYHAEKL